MECAADSEEVTEENSSAPPPLDSSPLSRGCRVCEANARSFMCNFSKTINFGLSAKLMGRPCSPCPPCNNWALYRVWEVIKIVISVRVEGGLALSLVAHFFILSSHSTFFPARAYQMHCPLAPVLWTILPVWSYYYCGFMASFSSTIGSNCNNSSAYSK